MTDDDSRVQQRDDSSPWRTFLGWHTDMKFWRDVYARMASVAIPGFVAYVVAALSGVVTQKPLAVVSAVAMLACLITFVRGVAAARGHWREVLTLQVDFLRGIFVTRRDPQVSTRAKWADDRLSYGFWGFLISSFGMLVTFYGPK